jgi:hypothetical protein
MESGRVEYDQPQIVVSQKTRSRLCRSRFGVMEPPEEMAEELVEELGTVPPTAKPVTFLHEEVMEEWLSVATQIGAVPQMAASVELDMWLRSECIPIYRTRDVFAYLAEKAKENNGKFGLHGLRKCDATPNNVGVWLEFSSPCPEEYAGTSGRTLYERVPLPVLLTAQKVIDRFGDRAKLHVTYVQEEEDPFLGVSIDNCSLRFIERWDEPSFRGSIPDVAI